MEPATVFEDPATDEAFRRWGYVVVPFLEPHEVSAVQRLHDELCPSLPSDFVATVLSDNHDERRRVSRGIGELVQSRLSALLPHHKLSLATFVTKRPRSREGRLPLHQDWWIVDNRVHRGLHVWCPLVDVDEHNGCLRVVPGIHRLLNDPYPISAKYRTAYHPVLDLLEAEHVRYVPMRAGSALLYDQRMLHASDDNLSGEVRGAFNCIMIPRPLKPHVYSWDERMPGTMQFFEVDEDFLCSFRLEDPLREPYPSGVSLLESFTADVQPLCDAALASLKSVGTAPFAGSRRQPRLDGQPLVR